jgi:hypothetical protein
VVSFIQSDQDLGLKRVIYLLKVKALSHSVIFRPSRALFNKANFSIIRIRLLILILMPLIC